LLCNDNFSTVQYRQSLRFALLGTDDSASQLGCYPKSDGILSSLRCIGGLYIYLFISSITPESAQALSNPQLADIARFFADENAAATGWIHFLVMDLFVGRWIYWEGQRTGVWTVHSLALCLFAGPMGLLSHIVTNWIRERFSSPSESDSATPSTSTPQP
jgi:hypothetical protein